MTRRLLSALVALGVAVALASCTDPSPEPVESTTTQTEDTSGDDPQDEVEPQIDPQFSDADVAHAQQFLVLHRTSLELHEIIRSKADMADEVGTVSLSLYTTHYDEIDVLEQMLTTWDAPVPGGTDPEGQPDDGADGGNGGTGDDGADDGADNDLGTDGDIADVPEVVTEDEIRALGRASGAAANVMYLEQMIALHRARSSIAEDAIRDGENSDLVDLAQNMLTNQQHEVTLMNDIIAQLDPGVDEDDDGEGSSVNDDSATDAPAQDG